MADLRWAGLLPLMLMRSTKLSATSIPIAIGMYEEHSLPCLSGKTLSADRQARLLQMCFQL